MYTADHPLSEVDATTALTRNISTEETEATASIVNRVPTAVDATIVHTASTSTGMEKDVCTVGHHPMEAVVTTVLTELTNTNR